MDPINFIVMSNIYSKCDNGNVTKLRKYSFKGNVERKSFDNYSPFRKERNLIEHKKQKLNRGE